jgi:translation initiation factor 2A
VRYLPFLLVFLEDEWTEEAYAVKLEDGSQHKNLRVFSVSTGDQLIAFSQKSQDGWDLQYTISEANAVRLVGQEVQVYTPGNWEDGIVSKLRVEGATSIALSPGLNPSVAVFIGEKKVRQRVELRSFP